jgi:DNA invertase Pin-like site-specific DNA recombinase
LEVFRVEESASKEVRKKFDDMLNWMNENEVKILLVEKQDRYSRQSSEDFVESLKRVCSEFGIDQIHFPKDSKIWDRKEGWTAGEKLQARVMSAVATYKSDLISEEVKKAFAQMLKRGEPPYTPPLGYKSIPKDKNKGRPRMIIKTDEAEKVKQLLEIFNAKRLTLSQALKVANNIGLRSSKGNKLVVREDIARIVKERFYFGEFVCKGKIYEIKVHGYEPLISKQMWEENQEILKQRKKYRKPEGSKMKFRFNQLIHCGHCGRLLFGIQPVYRVKWKKVDGSISQKEYKYPIKYGCTHGPWFTVDGTVPIPKEYIDEENLVVKENITYDGDYYFNEKADDWKVKKETWLKKGTKVQKLKCGMPYFMETEIERILADNIDLIKFNRKNWKEMKSKLFKDETKEFLDYEIQSLRSEQSKNETKMEKLYADYDKGVITGDFTKKQQDKIEARQQEVRKRLNKLEEERQLYDQKIGRSIQIIDNLKSWKQKWEAASDDKKNEMLRLMTVKISTFWDKRTIDGKDYEWKDLQIVWNEEFSDLFGLGIFEQKKKKNPGNPGHCGCNFNFNSAKIRDG